MQKVGVIGVALVVALTGSSAPHAQSVPSNQRVWTGTWEEHDSWEGSAEFGRSQAQISFVYVQGRDEFGLPRWESRRLTWTAVWEDHRFDRVWVEKYGEADERGIYSNRSRMDIVTVCEGGGTLELGPTVWGGEDLLTPEQKAQLRLSCVTTYHQRERGPTPPATLSQRDALDAPSVPNEDQLTGCSYEKTWRMGTNGAGSLSVSVSAPVTAVMEVDPDPKGDYGRFVPVPGETLIFTASVPAGTARFRFELDPEATSRFPGYATNASVDDMFFFKHNLGHLSGNYANDGPDFIFDSERFGRQEWSRLDPLVVETRIAQSAAVVTVTAMDYGGVGKLRGFVKSEECGDWQPIPIRVGTATRDAVAIPMDDDNNLMADALEAYRGRDSGTDDDAEPKGNGMAGDGLTAFEEYRGFLIRGATCPVWSAPAPEYPDMPLPEPMPGEESPPPPEFPQWTDEHIRTTPRHKNLFVHSPDPEFGLMVEGFAWSSDLSVHLICEPHYVDDDTRIINFTLQQAGLRNWQGKRVSQDEPQHGVPVVPVDFHPYGGAGVALAVDSDSDLMGPPKFYLGVMIYKPSRRERLFESLVARRAGNEPPPRRDPQSVLMHELSHVVGVPHHGDRVENWRVVPGKGNVTPTWSPFQREGGSPPAGLNEDVARAIAAAGLNALLLLPGSDCDIERNRLYRDGRFAGCWAMSIARRGQQNSGNFDCPVRYAFSHRYEAPGSTAVYRWTGVVRGSEPGAEPVTVDAWEGNLPKYANDLDRDPTGKLCATTMGTEINALPRDRNHAGDAGRQKACREFLVVNDLAARGVR